MTHPLVETVARAMNPELFSEDEMTRHMAASPIRVDVAQDRARKTAAGYLATILSNGYAIAPVEPTDEELGIYDWMSNADAKQIRDQWRTELARVTRSSRAMLSSAPKVVG